MPLLRSRREVRRARLRFTVRFYAVMALTTLLFAALVGGFYEPEPWGIWSRIGAPWVMLPFHTRGRCRLAVEVTAYGPNVGRTIEIELGGQVRPLPLSGDFA